MTPGRTPSGAPAAGPESADPRARRLAFAFLGAGLLASVLSYTLPGLEARSAIYLAAVLASVAGVVTGLRRARHGARLPWGFMAGGLALWLCGEAWWSIYDLLGQNAEFPSPADVFYTAGYASLFGGVVLLASRERRGAYALTLDAAIIGSCGGLFGWAVGFHWLAEEGSVGPGREILGTFYPTADAVLLAALVQLLFLEGRRNRPSLWALVLCTVGLLATDTLWTLGTFRGTYGSEAWFDAGWLVAYALLAFAALDPSGRRLSSDSTALIGMGTKRLCLLLLSLLLVPTAIALHSIRGEAHLLVLAGWGLVIVVLIFARMALLFREQQRTAEELRRSQELHRLVVENSADMIAIFDMEGRYVWVSPAHERIRGYSPDELVGTSALSYIHPDDRPSSGRMLSELDVSTGTFHGPVVRTRRKDGSWVYVEGTGSVFRSPDGEEPVMLAISRDVTERVRAEEALRASEELFRTVFEHSSAGLALAAPDGRWLKANRAFCEMLGYTEEELLARDFRGVTHPDDLAVTIAQREPILRGDAASIQLEKRYLHKDGRTIWALLNLACVRDADGQPVLLVGQTQDITARKKAEEELRLLVEAGSILGRSLDPGEVSASFARIVRGLMEYDGLFVAAYEPADTLIRVVYGEVRGEVIDPRTLPAVPLDPEERSTPCEAIRTGKPLLVHDFAERAHFQMDRDGRLVEQLPEGEEPIRSALIAPILVEGEGRGTVSLVSTRPDAYTEDDLRVLVALVSQVAVASTNAVLYQQARREVEERRRAEQALAEREELLRTMFDHSSAGLGLTDRRGRWLKANPAFCELLGYSEEELLEMRVHGVVHPDDLPPQLEGAERLARGETDSVQLEQRLIRKDGGIVWALLSLACFRDADGHPALFVGQIQDVTARKKAETELRLLAEAGTILGRSLHPREVSAAFARIVRGLMPYDRLSVTTYDPADGLLRPLYVEAAGKVIDARTLPPVPLDPDGRGLSSEAIRTRRPFLVRDFAERAHFHLDREGRRVDRVPDGEEPLRSALIAPILLDGEGRGAIGLFSTRPDAYTEDDLRVLVALVSQVAVAGTNAVLYQQARREVDERRRAEQALAKQERLLQAIVDAEPECVKLIDLEGRITMINTAGVRMCGAEREEQVLGNRFVDRVAPEDAPAVEAAIAVAAEGGQGHAEFDLLALDGRRRRFDAIIAPLRDAADEIRSLVCVTRDVTERRELEEQLRQSQKMEAVGRLAGGIAHDFNNLLTAVVGYAGLAASRAGTGPELREDLAQIEQAASRAADLTRQLLAFSRRQLLQPRVLDVNEVVESASSLLRPLVGEDIDFSVRLAPGAGAVKADPGQLAQVIVNLAVNARDAMPDGGTLAVETAGVLVDEARSAELFGAPPGPYAAIVVSDSGCGMSEETVARVFEPFFTTKGAAGTGLGLSTVYGIVKQSGGYVTVESEPGAGATFTICLPRVEDPDAVADPPPALPAASRGSETILLVEDEDVVRALVKEVLEQDGYTVLAAGNPAEALELCASGCDFDLLLTDLVMPGMDGRELAKRIRECRPQARVLLVSGYAEQGLEESGLADPRTAFLQKPFMAADLVATIRGLLDGAETAGCAA